jgi:hypothetical protein
MAGLVPGIIRTKAGIQVLPGPLIPIACSERR